MSRILVTGGTGYVGARLAAHLAGQGADVVVTTRQPVVSMAYLPGVVAAQVDYAEKTTLCRVMDGVELIYHLAAANEVVAGKDPQRAVKDNITDALNVLDAAVEMGVPRFINFSTAHVYGPLLGRITEDSPTRPMHPYAITHLAFEHFLRLHDRQGQIEGLNIRLSNAIGAPQHAGIDRWMLVANELCRMAVQAGELRLKSDGTQVRDFVPLSDVVRIVSEIGKIPRSDLDDGTFNLGKGRTETVGSLAQMIQMAYQAKTGNEIAIHYGPPPGAVPSTAPLEFSVDKLRSLGLSADTPLEDELAEMLNACITFFEKT